jgi:hypothetical protein
MAESELQNLKRHHGFDVVVLFFLAAQSRVSMFICAT